MCIRDRPDTGTHESLLEASSFVSTIQKRQGYMIACPEEAAFVNKWISKTELKNLASSLDNNYGRYLLNISK